MDRPGFWRSLFMGRQAIDAYGIAVFESKGWTREEARRGMAEVRAAARGVPHSPWFKRKWAETVNGD